MRLTINIRKRWMNPTMYPCSPRDKTSRFQDGTRKVKINRLPYILIMTSQYCDLGLFKVCCKSDTNLRPVYNQLETSYYGYT